MLSRPVRRRAARAGPAGSAGALVGERPPGLIASIDLLDRGVADLDPGRQRGAQALVGDVAVAVVGVLGEDRAHELGDRVPVRVVDGTPVELAQPVADRADPRRAAGAVQLRSGDRPARPSDGGYFARDECASSSGSSTSTASAPSTAASRGDGRARPSSCTATRPTPRTGCRSSSGSSAAPSPSTCPAGASTERRSTASSTTRCTGWRGSSSASSRRSEIDEYSLVVHDWGVVGLIAALRRPQQVRRLVVINAVPLLPGYRWHWVARCVWRLPVARRARQRDHHPAGAAADHPRQATARPRSDAGRAGSTRCCASWPRGHLAAAVGALPLGRPRAAGSRRRAASSGSMPGARRLGPARTPTCRRASARQFASRLAATRSWSSSTAPATGRGSTAPTCVRGRSGFLSPSR